MALIRPKAIRKWTKRKLRAPVRVAKKAAPFFYGISRSAPAFGWMSRHLKLGTQARRAPGFWHGIAIGVPDDRWGDLDIALPEFAKLFASVRTDPKEIADQIKRRKPDALLVWGYSAGRIIRELDIDHGIRLPLVHVYDSPLDPGHGPVRGLVVDWSGLWINSRRPCDLEDMLNFLPLNHFGADLQVIEHQMAGFAGSIGPAPRELDTILLIAQDPRDPVYRLSTVQQIALPELVGRLQNDFPEASINVLMTSPFLPTNKLRRPSGIPASVNFVDPDLPLSTHLAGVNHVCTVSSPLALFGLMADRKVTTYGTPFYAGWGLTDDKTTMIRRERNLSLLQLVGMTSLGYTRWIDNKDSRLLPEAPREVWQ